MKEKKFEYRFDSALGIIFKTYYGAITVEDIESSWEFAFSNNIIPETVKGFILDYRKSNFDIEIEEYANIPKFYRKHIDVFRNLKIAIVTENPRDIVIPILVEAKDKGYESRPFSTMKAATNWILS